MKYEPTITPTNDGEDWYEYRDGDVIALLNSNLANWCEINEISSFEPGQGNGRKAVEWLRAKFNIVNVNDPGNEIDSPAAFSFWRRLTEAGLIAEMTDENGNVIYRDGNWVLSEIDNERFPHLFQALQSRSNSQVFRPPL